jgi:hypothetical protein
MMQNGHSYVNLPKRQAKPCNRTGQTLADPITSTLLVILISPAILPSVRKNAWLFIRVRRETRYEQMFSPNPRKSCRIGRVQRRFG